MPRVSVWLIRSALLHLLSGALLGAAYLFWKAEGWLPFSISHLPVHMEQMLVGWLVQMVIGVAYWILPRLPDQPRDAGSARMWFVWALLNGGVLAAALGGAPGWPAGLSMVGRMAEGAAAALFAHHAWSRQRALRVAARRILV